MFPTDGFISFLWHCLDHETSIWENVRCKDVSWEISVHVSKQSVLEKGHFQFKLRYFFFSPLAATLLRASAPFCLRTGSASWWCSVHTSPSCPASFPGKPSFSFLETQTYFHTQLNSLPYCYFLLLCILFLNTILQNGTSIKIGRRGAVRIPVADLCWCLTENSKILWSDYPSIKKYINEWRLRGDQVSTFSFPFYFPWF